MLPPRSLRSNINLTAARHFQLRAGHAQSPRPDSPAIFGWADTPWTVAALLGAWGVMIGIEEFFLADVFMVLAGGFCTWRLALDCFQKSQHRWIPFLLWLALIIAVIGVDIQLTARKKASSEAKAQEIPGLTSQIRALQDTTNKQNDELNQAQGKTDQRVSDIQQENRELKQSIEKKDAELVSLAKQQYSLNFLPQVIVTVQGDPNQVAVTNNGKTGVTLYRVEAGGLLETRVELPQGIPPGASTRLVVSESQKQNLLVAARFDQVTRDFRGQLESAIYIETEDNRRYRMAFTWVFIVKDGALSRSFATDQPIEEIK